MSVYNRSPSTNPESLADIEAEMNALQLGVELDFRQTNSEAELITWIGETRGVFDGIVINPAALTHTSLRLAVADVVPRALMRKLSS